MLDRDAWRSAPPTCSSPLDSIPAIFGLTQDPYIVFTANAFALMGLRQLYFLIGGLLERLVHLPYGLSVILGFIGVKLVLHALHTNTVPFVNGGRPVELVPEVPTWLVPRRHRRHPRGDHPHQPPGSPAAPAGRRRARAS